MKKLNKFELGILIAITLSVTIIPKISNQLDEAFREQERQAKMCKTQECFDRARARIKELEAESAKNDKLAQEQERMKSICDNSPAGTCVKIDQLGNETPYK